MYQAPSTTHSYADKQVASAHSFGLNQKRRPANDLIPPTNKKQKILHYDPEVVNSANPLFLSFQFRKNKLAEGTNNCLNYKFLRESMSEAQYFTMKQKMMEEKYARKYGDDDDDDEEEEEKAPPPRQQPRPYVNPSPSPPRAHPPQPSEPYTVQLQDKKLQQQLQWERQRVQQTQRQPMRQPPPPQPSSYSAPSQYLTPSAYSPQHQTPYPAHHPQYSSQYQAPYPPQPPTPYQSHYHAPAYQPPQPSYQQAYQPPLHQAQHVPQHHHQQYPPHYQHHTHQHAPSHHSSHYPYSPTRGSPERSYVRNADLPEFPSPADGRLPSLQQLLTTIAIPGESATPYP